jgi:hypothetical protein
MLALPLPLFLVAEAPDNILELIDGMQRLNAIFSFIEQEFSYNGKFFDLDTLADTKALKDAKKLVQQEPKLSRDKSVYFSNYTLALSVYRAEDESSIDEVFRRINSGGRRLSKQELRQAGTISPLADLVRKIASAIRTDNSPDDSLPLRLMPQLSISNRNLNYGVFVEDIYWVHEGILRSGDVRESADEQVILDILIDLLVQPTPTSSGRTRDECYSFTNSIEQEQSKSAYEVSASIGMYGSDKLQRDFLAVYDAIREVVEFSGRRFSTLLGVPPTGRAPRYYHALFVAMYELMFRENPRRVVRDIATVSSALDGMAAHANIARGGDWLSASKRQTIDAFKGILFPKMEPTSSDEVDPGHFGWASELESLLSNSLVEHQLFDHKQGFHKLDDNREFDDDCLTKVVRTLTAISNMGKNKVGYVVFGITDKEPDTARIVQKDGIQPRSFRGFSIVGIEREASLRGESLNNYWTRLIQRITTHPGIKAEFGKRIGREAKLVSYHGLAVGVLRTPKNAEPTFFDGRLYERIGSETCEVLQSDYMRVFSRFTSD